MCTEHPGRIDNGDLIIQATSWDCYEEAIYICDVGWILIVTEASRVCQPLNTWSGSVPFCQRGGYECIIFAQSLFFAL